MSLVSFTPVTDGSTATAAGVNTPLSTIYNDYNGNITDANISASAAIAFSKVSGGTATALTAWQSWTPSWVNLTVGNSTVVAAYNQIGKTVRFRLLLTLGSTGSFGSSPTFTLPVTSVSTYVTNMPIGYVLLVGSIKNFAPLTWGSTTTAALTYTQADGTYVAVGGPTATVPFTWVAGNQIMVCGEYEAA